MAKKKAVQKKKPNYTGWIIAAVIVLIVVLLVMKWKPLGEEKTPTGTKEPTTAGTVSKALSAPEFIAKCDLNYVIGVAKRCYMSGDVAKMPVINSGKGTISGMWFEVETQEGKIGYFKSGTSMAMKATVEYTLELESWASDLGGTVKSVTLYPMTSDGKACQNQRISQQMIKCE